MAQPTQQQRRVQTPLGEVEYTLTRKRVRNLNLRINPAGGISVSAPSRVSLGDIDGFVREKAGWIFSRLAAHKNKAERPPCRYSKEQCLALFTTVSDRVFPLFADVLGGVKPELQVKDMKTLWGVCRPEKRRITLNMRLAEKPMEAIEYVVLHEYVHFLHADHQAGFHAEMQRLMPDYRTRRRLLREPE